MPISPTQSSINQLTSFTPQTYKTRTPTGLSKIPDQIENNREFQSENPPSLFKKFFFQPIIGAVIQGGRFFLRSIFNFIDFLRKVAFNQEENLAHDKQNFLNSIRAAPTPDSIFLNFTRLYSREEQDALYKEIGEAQLERASLKELLWIRTPKENIEIGRRLVRQNPLILRDHIAFYTESG